jgi:hypothetical protein
MSYTFMTAIALLATAQAQSRAEGAAAIDAAASLQSTPIRLDVTDRTLAEIVEQINAQAPASVTFRPESTIAIGGELPKPPRPPRRFTLHEPKPMSFWQAIDRVCGATSTWPSPETQPGPGGRAADRRVVLVPASSDRGFVCNDRVFRMALTGLVYMRDVRFAPVQWPQPARAQAGRDGPSDLTFFTADLHITAEPRLKIERLGRLTMRDAIDDQGRNLVRTGSRSQFPNVPLGVIHQGGMSAWLPLELSYPENPGKVIKRLSGSVSALVSLRDAGSRAVGTDMTFEFTDVPMP